MNARLVVVAVLLAGAAAHAQPRTDLHGDLLPDGAIARFGTVRFRLGSNPFGSCLSADGRTLAVKTEAGVVVWDTETGRPRLHVPTAEPSGEDSQMCLSSDGKLLAHGTQELLEVYDTTTGRRRWSRRLQGPLVGMHFYPGTTALVVKCDPPRWVVYDAADGQRQFAIEFEDWP